MGRSFVSYFVWTQARGAASVLQVGEQDPEDGEGGKRSEPDQRKSPEWLDFGRVQTSRGCRDERLSPRRARQRRAGTQGSRSHGGLTFYRRDLMRKTRTGG
jgi:hypothetical protein